MELFRQDVLLEVVAFEAPSLQFGGTVRLEHVFYELQHAFFDGGRAVFAFGHPNILDFSLLGLRLVVHFAGLLDLGSYFFNIRLMAFT